MRRRLFSAPALLVYALLLGFLAVSWNRLAGTEMSWQGWLAFALGCLLSLALAGLLMGLLFHSNRSGADDSASDQKAFRRARGAEPDAPPDREGDESR